MKKELNKMELEGIKKPKLLDYTLIKSPTGIKGFDDITFGGIPQNRPTLLVGEIGCGKTFMAMEYIVNGVLLFNEPGVFMTFEEKEEELLTNVSNLRYDVSKLIAENKIFLEHLSIGPHIINETGTYNIEGLFLV
jgi:circadian clock protein KaiC